MAAVTTRELKQNPAAAIRRVLEAGQAVMVTAHGADTGVVIAPRGPALLRWVPGHALAAIAPMSGAHDWQRDLASARNEGFGRNLWDDDLRDDDLPDGRQ